MERLALVTGSRAEYGILRPVMARIREARLELMVVVAGMHLAPTFGETVREIEADGIAIAAKVEMTAISDDPAAMVDTIGRGIAGLGRAMTELNPDLVLVLGDRVEAFAAAIAGAGSNRAVAHLHGGDVSRGGLDESMRHAITKLAHLHFAATEKSRERIVRMGERPDRVFAVGAPGLDAIHTSRRASIGELEKLVGAPLPRPLVVLVQHPVTTRADQAQDEMRETLEALDVEEHTTVCLYPNADAGGRRMIEVIESFRDRRWLHVIPNLEHSAYLSLLAVADVLIGNSSSGIIEAPFFHLPVVNIGERQAGRERGDNVLDVAPRHEDIIRALKRALGDAEFRERVRKGNSPYGDGRASERIVAVLQRTRIGPELIQKQFVD
ncbi:MAG TPA: UDP-N-acetylglucosamine 2-epimerase [Candidatus Limnocylindria bacterium]|nr:UDP-N-acetylglucosamine 2-epimerase [Candidatus Limnocylindria bacterium]